VPFVVVLSTAAVKDVGSAVLGVAMKEKHL